jgi:hypothetical protein
MAVVLSFSAQIEEWVIGVEGLDELMAITADPCAFDVGVHEERAARARTVAATNDVVLERVEFEWFGLKRRSVEHYRCVRVTQQIKYCMPVHKSLLCLVRVVWQRDPEDRAMRIPLPRSVVLRSTRRREVLFGNPHLPVVVLRALGTHPPARRSRWHGRTALGVRQLGRRTSGTVADAHRPLYVLPTVPTIGHDDYSQGRRFPVLLISA